MVFVLNAQFYCSLRAIPFFLLFFPFFPLHIQTIRYAKHAHMHNTKANESYGFSVLPIFFSSIDLMFDSLSLAHFIHCLSMKRTLLESMDFMRSSHYLPRKNIRNALSLSQRKFLPKWNEMARLSDCVNGELRTIFLRTHWYNIQTT